MTQIWEDIKNVIAGFFNGGRAFTYSVQTNGNSVDTAIAVMPKAYLPALSIANNGVNNVKFGIAKASITLKPNQSYTFRYKNWSLPSNVIVVNDLGNAGVEIDVSS